MKQFNFFTAKSLLFGPGVVEKTGDALMELRVKKALIVSDAFLIESGLVNKVTLPLEEAGIEYALFKDFEPSPTLQNAESCFEFLQEKECDGVIGFGGGSSIDTSKAAALLVNNPPPVKQYIGVEKVPNPAIPIIAIPTTAGTGSEVSNASILKDDVNHVKGGIMSHHLAPSVAIVDPNLTLSMPPRLTASTGLDALTHAIEGYVAVKASPLTEMYHGEAIRLIAENLRTAVARGSDREARYNMALGAMYAGIGMATASCGAVHALAYPLESKYTVAHGDANASLLPAVMRFNVLANMKKFRDIAILMGENVDGLSMRDAALKAADAVAHLCADVKVPKLREIGVKEEDLDEFAEIGVGMSRLMDNNPRKCLLEDAKKIYRESF